MANEYVLKLDGRVLRRPFEVQCPQEQEIQIDAAIFASLNLNTVRKIRHVRTNPDGDKISLCSTDDKGTCYFSTRLSKLHLHATMKAGEKTVTPSFESKGEFVKFEWTPPEDMRLMFVAHVWPDGGGLVYCEYVFLFALHHPSNTSYQLPLPNLYNDCHLCTGVPPYQGACGLDVFEQALMNFKASKWNNHIIHENKGDYENSQALFQFQPVKDGFKTLAPTSHWTKLSRKMGTDILNYIVL